MGPAELLDYGRDKLLGLVLEDAAVHLACRHRGALHGPAAGVARWKASPTARAPATPSWWTAKPAKCICARQPRSSRPSRKSARCARQAQARFAAIRDLPAVTRDGVRDPADDECRPGIRHAASEGIRRRRHRPVPHRTAIHDRRDHAAPGRPVRLLQDRSSMPRATSRWCSAPSIWAATRCLPYARWEREENPALGWRAIRIALDRPALLRYQVRALLAASAGPHAAHPAADGAAMWTSSTAAAP